MAEASASMKTDDLDNYDMSNVNADPKNVQELTNYVRNNF